MKRIFCIFLTIIVMFTSNISAFADEVKYEPQSAEGQRLYQYLNNKTQGLLVLRNNYCYMTFVEDFTSDALSLYLLEMTDKLINTGSKPDKNKYMETLVNIVAASDLDRADNVANQKKMDNLKSLKDYAMDFSEMGKDAVAVMAGSSSKVSALENELKIAVNGVYTLADNTDNWVEAISNLETITQDYTEHDAFLELIENKSDGELREAASTLRSGMSAAFKIKLDTYADVSNENFRNYEEFFFSDIFFEAIKNMPEYENDEALKLFTNAGDSVVSKIGTLNSAWNLGKAIGTLVGDVVVGGENLINRVLEMMAIYDISLILQDKLLDAQLEFIKNVGKDKEIELAEEYTSFSNYLIGCRLRGEYCLYSTVAKDAGLLSWFDKESAQEAESWYNNKAERILNIQKELLQDEEEDTWKIIPKKNDSEEYTNAVYVDILQKYETEIRSWESKLNEYNSWFDDADASTSTLYDKKQVAITDINGDGVEELLFVADTDSKTNEGWEDYTEDLYVFTIQNGQAVKVYQNRIFTEAAGGHRYLIVTTTDDQLVILDTSVDAFEDCIMDQYSLQGSELRRENNYGLLYNPFAYEDEPMYSIKRDEEYVAVTGAEFESYSQSLSTGFEKVLIKSGGGVELSIYDIQNKQNALAMTYDEALQHLGINDTYSQDDDYQNSEDSSWKQAYVDYIKNDQNIAFNQDWCTCGLVFIDGDDIPELIIEYSNEADGTGILSIKNGGIVSYRFSRTGGIRYIEREGQIYNSIGHQGLMEDELALLDDSGFHDQGHGYRYDESQEYTNYTEFNWNGKDISENEYYANIDQFDVARAKEWNSYADTMKNNNYTPSEICSYLSDK